MGRSLPVFLMRAAGILIAGMLLFSVFAHAHAWTIAASVPTAAVIQ
jgi:hypothetical protein